MFEGFFGPSLPQQEEISAESVSAARRAGTRRICFATSHVNALKAVEAENYCGSISVPFLDTIGPIFRAQTDLDFFSSKISGYWRSIRDETEFRLIGTWVEQQGHRVFLKDCLALSIALGENMNADRSRTELGDLEYQAKYEQRDPAIEELVTLANATIDDLPYYCDADAICAVPASKEKSFDLPGILAQRLAAERDLLNLTPKCSWARTKPSLKNTDVTDKWAALENANLQIEPLEADELSVILLDDLSQSGTTMQYVAMKLQEAGVTRIYGLSMVKSRGDADNV